MLGCLSFSVAAKSRQFKFGAAVDAKRTDDDRRTLETIRRCRGRLRADNRRHINVINAWIVTDDVTVALPRTQQEANSPRRWHSHNSLDYSALAQQISASNSASDVSCIEKQQAYFRSLLVKMPTTVINDRMAVNETDVDKLPVVELKPFITSTKKEWRPSNSWVDCLDFDGSLNSSVAAASGPHPAAQPPAAQSRQTAPPPGQEPALPPGYYQQMGYPNPQRLTPRVTDGICAKAFPVTGERLAAHPKQKDLPDGSGSNRESFVPKPEREKSTAELVGSGSSPNIPTTFMQRSLTEVEIQKQRDMRVDGVQYKEMPVKKGKIYYEPW